MRKSLTLLLALLGLFDSLYLLWSYTTPSRPMVCFGGGCDAVRASVYSHIAGIPMPLLGVAGYGLIILLIVGESLVPARLAKEVGYALAAVTGFGFLYSLHLEYLQGFVIHAYCTWCVTSGVVMTLLFGLAVYNVFHPAVEADASAQLSQLRKYFVVGVASVLMGVPAFYQLSEHGEAPPPPPPPPSASAPELVRPDSRVFGNLQSPVTVVEFGDFECPACGREEPIVREIRTKYADRVRFVFRQFPLIHIHPFAQRMAEASECAGEQGKFWEAVDKIYSRQDDLTDEGLKRDAKEIGLDMDKFNSCLSSGAMTARVLRDRADAKALGVNSTPTFFIGRQVLTDVPDLAEFSQRIDRELAPINMEPLSAPAAHAATGGSAATQTKNPPSSASTPSKPPAATSSRESSSSPFGLLGAPGGALSAFQTSDISCSEADAAKKQPDLINTRQLRDLLATNSQPLFVDVRPAKEFAAGQIPGAINIPIDDMPKRWDSLPRDRTIIFYESGKSSGDICASGRSAGRILLEHGYAFDHVKVYQDGLAGWQSSALGTNK